MKLISLNVEGKRHTPLVLNFITAEQPDVLCLLEAPEQLSASLEQLGYTTMFAPMLLREEGTLTTTEGVMFASKHHFTTTIEYYYGSAEHIVVQEYRVPETASHPILIATVTIDDETYTIATTHVMVTNDGHADPHQIAGVQKLLSILENKEPHILCGDFNMPRRINTLYDLFIQRYTDTIPLTYGSSLDKQLHRLGNRTDLNAPIFETYMVDYIFTQPPYKASDVRLQFGLSDHAAVIANIGV